LTVNQLFLTTKLFIPATQPELVPRSRLLVQLDGAVAAGRGLILLAAPPGFGKTTLLAEWLARHRQDLPAAWLSLDEDDNDPARFLSYIVAALRQVQPTLGRDLPAEQLASGVLKPLLAGLINDLADLPQRFVLVLDDYHLIHDPQLHEALGFLLEHRPPPLHLVISTRADPALPLARLRARGQLLELRARDLRLTADEAEAFLRRVMCLDLPPAAVRALEQRTEGWVAGLQLAALSLQGQADPAGFVNSFSGSNAFILDYLVDEVLSRQPAHLRRFLLRTAILERFCAPLCDAMLGGAGGTSQALLERLHRANLFTIALDDARCWYRYHHLFADVLQNRLQSELPDEVAGLHRRAAHWFAENGLPAEAVRHALQAGDGDWAAALIAPVIVELAQRGQHKTLAGWLDRLPEEALRERPHLTHWYAWSLIAIGRLREYERPLRLAEQAWRAAGNRAGLGEIANLRANMAYLAGDYSETIRQVRLALELLPAEDRFTRGGAMHALGGAHLLHGELVAAEQELIAARRLSEDGGSYFDTLYSINLLAAVRLTQGRLRDAETLLREVIALVGERPILHKGRALIGVGEIHRLRNDLAGAEEQMRQGFSLGEQLDQEPYLAAGYAGFARLLAERDRREEAEQMLDKAERAAARLGNPFTAGYIAAIRARLRLSWVGISEDVLRWAANVALVPDLGNYEREFEALTLARVRIAQGKAQEALCLLETRLPAAQAAGRMAGAIEMLVLTAWARQALGDTEGGASALRTALSLAAQERVIRPFVQDGPALLPLLHSLGAGTPNAALVEAVIAALPETTVPESVSERSATNRMAQSQAGLVEPLSERELEVLALIAAGLKNREIAGRLVIEESTVKRHLTNIYGKLGATSRTQALAKARELGLL
jgi:LuxR family maltose regulon positive regulatory protein